MAEKKEADAKAPEQTAPTNPQAEGTTPSATATGEREAASPLMTQDQRAQAFVNSDTDAKVAIKDPTVAPSAEVLRESADAGSVDNELMAQNIASYQNGESNHNSLTPTNPIPVQQVDRPDYNPQRVPSSRANQMSSLAESPQGMADRVNAKKNAPTNAELTEDRRAASDEKRDTPLPGYLTSYQGEQ